MFDKGFGVEVRKFLNPLRNRSRQPEGESFQTVLVTATVTKVFNFLRGQWIVMIGGDST